jgi:hypothetical protein
LENPAERSECDFAVERNGDGETLRVRGMAKADVTTLLADRDVTKFTESANQGVTRNYGSFGLIV